MIDLRIPFVIVYLIVDIVYVILSRPTYEGRARAIQGTGFPNKKGVIAYALLAYACMGIAWWVLVAERIRASTPLREVIRLAFVLGLAMYGVFNATLYVMFKEWDLSIFIRDLVWGTTWITLMTILFAITLRYVGRRG